MKRLTYVLLLCVVVVVSCYKETAVPLSANFKTTYVGADESVPVTIDISNTSVGASSYVWTFEGGTPTTANTKKPPQIVYNSPGTYTIKLTASNSDGESATHTQQVVIRDAIAIDYTANAVGSFYPPVTMQLSNATSGQGLTYEWTFPGGTPESFSGQHPPNVSYATPGEYTMTLNVNNGFETITKETTITVLPHLVSDFSWNVNFEDEDLQAPVTLNLVNASVSATNYSWSMNGASPNTATTTNPTIVFTNPGTYQISLTASNDKTSQTTTKSITIVPNTNLRVFTNVKFGINSAHNTNSQGAFFATKTGELLQANQVTAANGATVDLVFQGLNASFTNNKFISPNKAQDYGFLALTNAQNTVFVNSQELCNCGLNFTAAQFDAMTNDAPLQSLTIPNTPAAAQAFNNSLPRVVLFQTQDGRKGAIKITNMITNGSDSYMVCDIKVQKQ